MGVDSQKSRGTGSRPEWVPFPFLPFLSPTFLSPSPSSLALRSKPPLNSARGSGGSAVSSPSGVWGGAPGEIEFGAY